MPSYDYKCPACGAKKEVQHPMSEVGKIEVLCDECGQPMKKQLSMPALIGFDDVGRSGRNGDKDNKETTKKDTSKKETKADSGTKKETKSKTVPKKEKAG